MWFLAKKVDLMIKGPFKVFQLLFLIENGGLSLARLLINSKIWSFWWNKVDFDDFGLLSILITNFGREFSICYVGESYGGFG